MRKRFVNFALLCAATAVVLLFAEPIMRWRYVEPAVARPVVQEVQPWLILHPAVGFTWRHNVLPEQNIRFANADISAPALSTDEFGAINPPEAIARRRAGVPVDVLGLGDSFMEMASPDWYRAFHDAGLSYYSLGIHRQAPPQYALLFGEHGIPLKPKVVLVGLFENDFVETADFDNWQRSGLDWFAFHSGTWCGPSRPVTPAGRFLGRHFRGYAGLARVVRSRMRGDRMSVAGPSDDQVERVTKELARIAQDCLTHGAQPWLLLIPSKPTARGEPTAESRAYDRVLAALPPVYTEVVDLRPLFQEHPDPLSLYYQEDGHWNPNGVALAANRILGRMTPIQGSDESRGD